MNKHKAKKVILHICPFAAYPLRSGGQKKTWNLLLALNECTEVSCITTKDFESPRGQTLENITFYPILPNYPIKYIDLRVLSWVRKQHRRNPFDCVIIEQPFLGIVATLIKIFFNIPFVIHGHNVETLRFESIKKWWSFLIRIYEKWTIQRARHVFLISREDQKWVQNHWKVPSNRLSILPYFVSNPIAQQISEKRKLELRQKLQMKKGQKSLFFFGSLGYRPNAEALQIIIDPLLGFLRKTLHFPFQIYIAGNGLDNKTKQLMAQEPELIHLGFVSDILGYLQVMDVLLNPILSGGGVKTKVIEALTMRIPIVSTEMGAIGVEYADQQMQICSNGDWEAFAEATAIALEKRPKASSNSFRQHYCLRHAVEIVKKVIYCVQPLHQINDNPKKHQKGAT